MEFRNLDENNDWTFGKGRQNYAKTKQAINLNIKTILQTYLTECFFDTELGVPWFNALGTKDTDIILLETKRAIAEAFGVTEVIEVFFNVDLNRQATVEYDVKTIYTKQGETTSGRVTI